MEQEEEQLGYQGPPLHHHNRPKGPTALLANSGPLKSTGSPNRSVQFQP